MAGLVGLGWLPWQAQLGHRLSQGGRAARRLAWHRRTTRLQPAGTAGRLIRDEQTDKKVESGNPLYEYYGFGGLVLFTLLRCLFPGSIVISHFYFQLFVGENISFQFLTSIRCQTWKSGV